MSPSVALPPLAGPALTIRVLLVGVGDEAAVVWAGRCVVGDAIVVIVVVTVIPQPIVVRVQLGTVGDLGAVVLGVLVPVPITGSKNRVTAVLHTGAPAPCPCTLVIPKDLVIPLPGLQARNGWDRVVTPPQRGPYLSSLVSQMSPTRSLSISVWRRAVPWFSAA